MLNPFPSYFSLRKCFCAALVLALINQPPMCRSIGCRIGCADQDWLSILGAPSARYADKRSSLPASLMTCESIVEILPFIN